MIIYPILEINLSTTRFEHFCFHTLRAFDNYISMLAWVENLSANDRLSFFAQNSGKLQAMSGIKATDFIAR